ncbi:extracellular solute-binding protein [Tessaracoccus defluvii]|uniref:extracellular solute-binding protein n=1 Tax=Tessaracoccus defluvii TaxID=1285901 RepID=UPI0021F7C2AB|nr:extracellular solute-binding protein [Tessaracoccus defluvii]
MPKFVENPQNFVDLNTLGAEEIAGDYLEWSWSAATALNGAHIGVPTDVGGMAVAYRTDLFEAAGLPTDSTSVSALWPTWDDFIKVGEAYVAQTGKKFVDNSSQSIFFQAVNQVEAKYYSPDGDLIYDSNPEIKAAFDLALKADASGISARLAGWSDGWNTGMGKGDFAVMAAPSWMLGSIRSNAPDTSGLWGVAEIPEKAGNWGGSYLAIPAGAKNPQAAWEYIKEMQSPESQLEHFVTSGALPTTPGVYADPALLEYRDPFFPDAPIGQIYTASVEAMSPFFIGPESGPIGTEFINAVVAVEGGSLSADEAWQKALDNIKLAIGE